MKKTTTNLLLSICLIFLLNSSVCGQLLTYTDDVNGALNFIAGNTTATPLIRVNGVLASSSPCTIGFSCSGYTNITSFTNAAGAVETSIKPMAGYVLNVTGFTTALRRNAGGPKKIRFAYSIDGVNWIAHNTDQTVINANCDSGTTLNFLTAVTVNAPTTFKFRIYGLKAGNSNGVLQILNLTINGTVSVVNCISPVNLTASSITAASANLNWNAVPGATNYKVSYRKVGTTIWTDLISVTNTISVSGLTPSTNYQFKVKTNCSGNNSSPFSTSFKFTTTASATLPMPDHIVILILENHKYSSIIGSPYAPYINSLATDTNSALFTQSYGITHPSQPNYLYLFSGSNQGVINNNFPANAPFITPNLASLLEGAGNTFKTYSEDLPGVGFNGEYAGAYARKHNPVANWMGTGLNQLDSTVNQPFTTFPQANFNLLPTVCYVVPNQDNDMHNGNDPTPIIIGDNWTNTNLNNYIQWAKTHNSLFILTFDEDNGTENNRIATIFTGPMVQAGQYANQIDHFNVLRTLEDMYNLPYAGYAATPIDFCWKTVAPKLLTSSDNLNKNKVSISPNPVGNELIVNSELLNDVSKIDIIITDFMSRQIFTNQYLAPLTTINIETSSFPKGLYFLKISSSKMQYVTKFIKH